MTTSTQTQLRRGTATQVNAMTPALGEAVVNTTNTRIHVGDGSTTGGIPHVTAVDLQNQTFQYSTVGGTGDVITLTNSPAVSALAAGQKVRFKAGADNTTNVTIATDGLTAKAAKYMVNGALAQIPAGGIKSGAIIEADYDGTQYQVTSGLSFGSGITAGSPVASTSGTSIDFTGIPATANRLTFIFNSVSSNGTSHFLLQLGSGSVASSGYVSSGEYAAIAATSTAGFLLVNHGASEANNGIYTFTRISSNIWVGSGMVRPSSGGGTGGVGSGVKTLSGALDRIRLTAVNGSDTFNAGSVNIFYE